MAPDPLLAGHDLNVGTFYYNRGDYIGALHRFQDAIAHDPASAEAYCRAGDAEMKLKRPGPARTDWQNCLRRAHDEAGPQNHAAAHWADHAHQQLERSLKKAR